MNKKLARFTSTLMLLAITVLFTNDTVNAATAYFNTYNTLAVYQTGYYGVMQGCAVDRTNNKMFSAKVNGDNTKSQIICYNIGTKKTTKIETTSKKLFHANDIAAVPSGTSTYLYIATLSTSGPSVVRLKVNADNTLSSDVVEYNVIVKKKDVDTRLTIGSITYDQENKVFILGSGATRYIGTFDTTNKKFVAKSSFTTDLSKVSINGAAEANYSGWTRQGACYYKGNYYVPLLNPDKKCQSVIVVYKVDTKQLMTNTNLDKPTSVSSRKDLSFRITSSAYPVLFEFESIDFDKNGVMYFSANRRVDDDTQSDMIGTMKDFDADNYAFK